MPTALQQAALAAVLQQQQQLAAAKAAVAAAAAAASSAQAAQQAAASSPTSATLSSPTQNVDSAAALHRLTMPGMQPMQMQMASTTGMQTGAMQGVPQFSGAGQLPMQMGVMLPQQLAGMPGLGMQQASVLQGSMGQPAMMQPQSGMQQATMPMQVCE